jgi:hypothetical protein
VKRYLLVFLLWFMPLTTFAQEWIDTLGTEAPPAETMGNDLIRELRVGKAAPYSGRLFDNATAARWTVRMDWYAKQLVLDTTKLREVLYTERALAAKRESELKASYERETRDLHAALAKVANPPFYRTVSFGFIVGALSVVVAGAATIALVH